MMNTSKELQTKLSRLYDLLDNHQADRLLLRRVSSFAWATCGAESFVNTAASEGAASLFITREHRYLLTSNIEAPRMEQEFGLADQGWEFLVSPWTEPFKELNKLVAGNNIAAGVAFPGAVDVSGEVARLRSRLTAQEGERFRQLGRLTAEAMVSAMQSAHPGISEYQITAAVSNETLSRSVLPIVNLVATDERV